MLIRRATREDLLAFAVIEQAACELFRGIGMAEAGTPAITLTTFAAVPWNGPYYARCGFRMLPDDMLTAGLREIRRQEAARGLDRWPRICVRRDL